MDGQQIIKKGYLYSMVKSPGPNSQSRDWQKKYYVLFSSTEINKARLDWFVDEDAYHKAPAVRKTIFIEEIKKVNTCSVNGRDHGFQVETLRRPDPFIFSAPNRHEKKDWMDHLKKLVEEKQLETPARLPKGGEDDLGQGVYGNQLWSFDEIPTEFEVTIGETPSAQHCNLNNKKRTLQIFSQCMALVHKTDNNKILFVWPHKFIRRYGRSKTSFTFEAGRRCASGEGVFILLTPKAEDLFQKVQQVNQENNDTNKPQPSLPMRSYGDHYGEIISAGRQSDTAGSYTRIAADYNGPPSPLPKPVLPSTAEQQRQRSLSSGSRDLPALPQSGSRSARPVQPLPPGGPPMNNPHIPDSYSNVHKPVPQMGAAPEDTYCSVQGPEENTPKILSGAGDYGEYAEPVAADGSSMSAVIAQMRIASRTNPTQMSNSDEYDVVTLNVMERNATSAGPDADSDENADDYGHLYGGRPVTSVSKSQKKNVKPDPGYQDVSQGM